MYLSNYLRKMHRIAKIYSMFKARSISTSINEGSATFLTIKDLPTPRSLPILGTKLDILCSGRGTRLHEYVDNRHKELGSIFCDQLGGNTNLVFISDPILIKSVFLNLEGKYPAHILPEPWVLYENLYGSKRGLFFMQGEEWLTNRRIANKHLLKEGCDAWLEDPIRKSIEGFVETWKIKIANGDTLCNLESELYKLSTHGNYNSGISIVSLVKELRTLNKGSSALCTIMCMLNNKSKRRKNIKIIINVLLGNSSMKTNRHYDELLGIFSDSVKKIFQTTTKLYGFPVHWYQRLNLKAWRDFKESVDLSLFLAHKISTEMVQYTNGNNGFIKKLLGENITNETITRIVGDFIIAAGDTTAYTTLWILLLLSKNKDVIDEIRNKEKPYIKSVVKESMRMFPVAPFLTRILPKDSYLGPYKLKEGTPIIASIYTSGRDEQNFSNPNTFLPFRWDRNDPRKASLTNHVPSASLPFALGARSCIGKKIAMIQLVEIISQVVNNFEFKCSNDSDVKAITSQVLIPNKSIKLILSTRK